MEITRLHIDLLNKKSTVWYNDDGVVEKHVDIDDKDKISINDVVTQEATKDFSDIFTGNSFQESAKKIIEYLETL